MDSRRDRLDHLTKDGVKDLPLLPSQNFPIPSNRYIIKHTEEAYIEASSSEIEAKIWFKSPPLKPDTISRVRALKVFAESHDQGFCSDKKAGNWTWLELAILEDEQATSPRKTKDGVELVWTSHMNKLASCKYKWLSGEVFDERRDFLSLLEEDNVIAVRLCARFAAWSISARNGYLVVEIGDEKVERMPVRYDPIISKITKIEETLRVVNEATDSAFLPSLPLGFNTANAIGKGAGEPPLRVLSFDGGGVRGLSSLLLLKAVMDKLAPNRKPCDVFDMIGGTSTGGLIAIMLGRLHMSVQECIDSYKSFMKDIFDHGLLKKTKDFVMEDGMYSSETLKSIIKKLIKDRLGDDDVSLLEEEDEKNGHRCKIFVMAIRSDAANNRGPVFLRSYKNTYDESLLPNIKLWEAARATSAAPYYFAPMEVGKYKLVDGGLGANNPLGWLWTEVLGVFGASRETTCFLSIGTGISANSPVPEAKGLPSLAGFANIATNSEITHVLFHGLIDAFAPRPISRKYWRLNVGEQVPEWEEEKTKWFFEKYKELHLDNYKDVGDLDDLKKLEVLVEMTDRYVKVNNTLIDDCAKALEQK